MSDINQLIREQYHRSTYPSGVPPVPGYTRSQSKSSSDGLGKDLAIGFGLAGIVTAVGIYLLEMKKGRSPDQAKQELENSLRDAGFDSKKIDQIIKHVEEYSKSIASQAKDEIAKKTEAALEKIKSTRPKFTFLKSLVGGALGAGATLLGAKEYQKYKRQTRDKRILL